MISFSHKGDFSKLTTFFQRIKNLLNKSDLDRYGELGCQALAAATPVDSGKTAASWYYNVDMGRDGAKLSFQNRNVNKGVPIAIILQYGHGTGTGGWVEGRDYINPALQPVFDKILADIWKEVERS